MENILKNNMYKYLKKFIKNASCISILVTFSKYGFFFTREEKSMRLGFGIGILTVYNYDYEIYVMACASANSLYEQYKNMPKRIITSKDRKRLGL